MGVQFVTSSLNDFLRQKYLERFFIFLVVFFPVVSHKETKLSFEFLDDQLKLKHFFLVTHFHPRSSQFWVSQLDFSFF
jgi:hypothetical protein